MKKHLITITLATGLLAFQEVRAFNPQPEPPGFGMFGVTPGQTLRLNVSDVPAASPVLYAPPCRVELTFLDSEGNQLLPAVQETIKVGASVHIDLNGDSLFPATTDAVSPTPARAEVRPLIHFLRVPTATAISLLPPGPCIATIEIIDNRTGQTLLTSGAQTPGSLVEFNPQPDPPRTPKTFGIMGIIPGQTARINAVNVGEPGNVSIPPPCRVTLAFFDVDGNAVSRASDILKPGEATFLDFPSAISTTSTIAVNTPGDVAPASQLQLRGVVTVSRTTPGAFAPPCRATFEAFDSLSGKTTAVQSPQRFLIAN